MGVLFAATYPQRTSALILYAATARLGWAPDYPWGRKQEELEARFALVEEKVGSRILRTPVCSGLLAGNDEYRSWYARFERGAASPGAAQVLLRLNSEIDTRRVLGAVSVPTIVLHRRGDRAIKVEHSRYLAQQIAGAKYVELAGEDHNPWIGDAGSLCDDRLVFPHGRTQWASTGSRPCHGVVHRHRECD